MMLYTVHLQNKSTLFADFKTRIECSTSSRSLLLVWAMLQVLQRLIALLVENESGIEQNLLLAPLRWRALRWRLNRCRVKRFARSWAKWKICAKDSHASAYTRWGNTIGKGSCRHWACTLHLQRKITYYIRSILLTESWTPRCSRSYVRALFITNTGKSVY